MVRYRSSRDPEVLYEATIDSCECPGFQHRGICNHVEQLRRWKEWGTSVPEDTVLDPPPPASAWTREETGG